MTGTLHEDKYIFMNISGSFLLRMIRFRTKFVEISKSDFFFRKIFILWDNVEKYCRAGQATDDNIAHAHCMLDT